jgi:hypothetical protein
LYQFASFSPASINYANEKLHKDFNDQLFIIEQEDYIANGVPWDNINYVDNSGSASDLRMMGGFVVSFGLAYSYLRLVCTLFICRFFSFPFCQLL